jgi:hypothetical protein
MARHEIATKRVVYEIDGADAVTVRTDLPYRESAGRTFGMDVYYPPGMRDGARLPVVVFALGFSDEGAKARLGCVAKEMESYICWARLAAMAGIVAVTYTTTADPAADLAAVLQRIQTDAAALNVDATRVGLWSCSGHAPTALAALMRDAPVRAACAALYYPYTIDLDGSTSVADAGRTFGFKTPCAGRGASDLSPDVPTCIVRAGLDAMPSLNAALDRFVAAALACNLPITLVNHSTGPHAFDLMDASDRSRTIIRLTLAFLEMHLGVEQVR